METTGADVTQDEIIEIGAILAQEGKATDTFSRLAKNTRPLSAPIIKLTGITPEMLKEQPALATALEEFLAFLPKDAVCLAHNAMFERKFLRKATGERFEHCVIDTVGLARICFPELESHSLACLCEHLDIRQEKSHRALADCQTLLQVWDAICAKLFTLPLAIISEINFLLTVHPTHPYNDLFKRLEAAALARDFGKTPRKLLEIYPQFDQRPPPPLDLAHKEDWTKLDRRKIEWVFEPGGFLEKSFAKFEPRPGQVKMAGEVVNAFNEQKNLLIEAGTGTGKSLAYLIPAVIWARENAVPVVVSTNTKNLQAQLFDKDLPFVKETLGVDFKAAVIKGRKNYLCLRKLFYLLRQAEHELDAEERMQLITILSWSVWSESGDISENIVSGRPGFFKTWDKLAGESGNCLGRACRHYRSCFLFKARAKALGAEIIIANHSLVFADLNAQHPNIPPHAQLIFDEAHNLEDAATQHLSAEISPLRFEIALSRLAKKSRKRKTSGLLASLSNRLESAPLDATQREPALRAVSEIAPLLDEAGNLASDFFQAAESLLERGKALSKRYDKDSQTAAGWEVLKTCQTNLAAGLGQIMRRLARLRELLGETEEQQLEYRREFLRDLLAGETALREFCEDLAFVLTAENTDYVYWLERASARPGNVRLLGAPITVGQLLADQLYARRQSIIFTSATLSVRGQFAFLKNRLGLDLLEKPKLIEKNVGSPFNYPAQCRVMIPTFLPEPGEKDGDYATALAELLAKVFRASGGRGMALYTSYEMLRRSYEVLTESYLGDGIDILAQGLSGSRKNITAIFQRDIHSVLLGTHSFWEGVDISGEALSCLCLARLPFAVFTDPLHEARCEEVESRGDNAFMNYSIPVALIRFRQGFGRLIRHQNDRGVVIIADRRIVAKRYGRQFKEALPCPSRTYADSEKLLADLQAFFTPENL